MSDERKAVFLSYASQDADAAKRICDALRQAGVEVWFDQSELVGGDAWDQKIRKQIKDCALLIPIISAATQARTEGYFRLEWRLADQRTHLMGRGRTFLLPVCIDDTKDTDADVPDSFAAVQWTRLRPLGYAGLARQEGEDPVLEKFATRVKKLLSKEVGPVSDRPIGGSAPSEAGHRPALPGKSRRGLIAALVGLVGVVIALAVARPWATKASPPAIPEATSEVAKVRARIFPDRWQKGDLDALSPAIDRLIQANPESADAWALRSIINSLQVLRLVDPGTKPLEIGKTCAERALRIAPDSPLGQLALGMHLTANVSRGGDPRASRQPIDRAVAALPPEALTRFAELVSFWLGYDFENAERCASAWLEAEPTAQYPAWIMTSMSVTLRRPDDVEKWAARSFRDQDVTSVRALCNLIEANYFLRGDRAAARTVLERIPVAAYSMARVIHWRWLLAMTEQRWDDALQILAQVPDAMLLDVAYNGPKALLAGMAHQRAGRTDAAAQQFREAERLLREILATDPDNEALRAVLGVTLASAGHEDEAHRELGLVEPLVRGRAPNVYRPRLVVSLAQAYGAMGDYKQMAFWLRKLMSEPSGIPLTPASLRLDPRFNVAIDASEIQALLKEFASLDQPVAVPKSKNQDPGPSSPFPVKSSFAKASEDGSSTNLAPEPKSVAVLAFANLSDDKANEYFSDGISEELLNVLAKVPGLKVSARTSAFYFKGKEVPVPEIARQLGVAYVVEGSVRKSGDKVRITAQLIKASDGFHVWSDTFTRDLKDIFAVQDEIAGLIAKNLELKMGVVAAARTVDPEAYRLYLEALPAITSRTFAGLDRAEQLITQAIARDPGLVPAQAALAVVWSLRAQQRGELDDPGSPLARRVVAQAELAVRLGPDWAEAQAACGFAYSVTLRFAEAEPFLRRAIQLNPSDASAHLWLGRNLLAAGHMAEALKALRQAIDLDPFSHRALDNYAFTLVNAGRPQDALEFIERALRIQPDSIQAQLIKAEILARTGRVAEALAIAERYAKAESPGNIVYAIEVFALAARRAALEEMLAASPPLRPLDRFVALVALGRNEEALAVLSQARIHWGAIDVILFNPQLDPIRREPAFLAKLQESGLAEAHDRAQAWRAAQPPEKLEGKNEPRIFKGGNRGHGGRGLGSLRLLRYLL